MPDSFPLPPWGPQPFDERDLDSLLDGKTADVPTGLRPVADTLNALRAAPSQTELRGESLVRSQFRGPRPEVPAARTAARPPGRGRFAGLVAAAAVIVLGAAVTYSGNLPGPVQRLAHDAIAAPSVKGRVSASASAGVQANSARRTPAVTHPAAGAAPSAASPPLPGAPDRTALCDAFWAALQHPRDGGQLPWQTPQYDNLSAAAGGPRQVFAYCFPVWKQQFPEPYPKLHEYPPFFPRTWSDGGSAAGQGQDQQQPAGRPRNGAKDSGGDTNPGTAPSGAPPPRTQAPSGDAGGQQGGN